MFIVVKETKCLARGTGCTDYVTTKWKAVMKH